MSVIQKRLSERPFLWGGLGLTAVVGLLEGGQWISLDSTAWAGVIAAGAGVWWWQRRRPGTGAVPPKPMQPVDRTAVEAAIAGLQPALERLRQALVVAAVADATDRVAQFDQRRQALQQDLQRTQLRLALVGPPRSGKTTCRQHLQTATAASSLALTEVALTAASCHPERIEDLLQQQDAVIYLVTEDLTESTLADLKQLTAAGQRLLVCLNKQDHYLPPQRATVLKAIQTRLQGLPQPVAAHAIAAAPRPIKVRTHTADGQVQERWEAQAAAVTPLLETVQQWLTQERAPLVTQTVMRQTDRLRQDIQQALNQARRQQALPRVEHLQWAAAATAFASPVPSLDLLAAIAINGQLVMDLGRVYEQPLSLEQAGTIARELATIVVKLGLVEVSTQLLTTALKSHAATYLVGGTVQAFSAAYLTRLCGESLIAYFEERALTGQTTPTFSATAISQKLQALLPETQQGAFLQALINQGRQRLSLQASPALPASAMPTVAGQGGEDPSEAPAAAMTVTVPATQTVSPRESA